MKTITDEELLKKIDEVSTNFKGQLDDLTSAIGMVIAGRLYGWRVIRLVNSRRLWGVACRLFGDLKEFLPERGVLANKSVGLVILEEAGVYWGVISGKVNRDNLPKQQRKQVA